ncbi:MAG TPA: MFS transporter, partial [Candidatus Gracilibacteria bacterium]|nr:MFS transporter [Candidatus Gracilibacteria bacterium]
MSVSHSMTLAMSVFSVTMISSALFEIPTGIISDTIGRRKTIIIGASFALLGIIFYSIGNISFLFGGAVLEGVARAFFSGNNDAFLYDNVKDNNDNLDFQKYLGRLRSMFYLPLVIIAPLSSIIAE